MSVGGLISEEIQLCPNCGDLVDELSDLTGWCIPCSEEKDILKCRRCGEEFRSKTHRPFCTYCRELNWLESHADELEEFMIQGCSFSAARVNVRANHKPICLGCGSSMPRTGYFCTSNPECRKLYNRYHRRRQKGMSEQAAIEQVLHDR